jgi:hypothetical protein
MALLVDIGTLRSWGLVKGSWVIGGVSLRQILGPWPLLIFPLCFPAILKLSGLLHHTLPP